jgi:hypothetical protein
MRRFLSPRNRRLARRLLLKVAGGRVAALRVAGITVKERVGRRSRRYVYLPVYLPGIY